jgi:hypothetical protein
MPAKIYMNIQNTQKINNVIKLNTANNGPTPFQQPVVTGGNNNSLSGPMISRIHTAKTGCGCGR